MIDANGDYTNYASGPSSQGKRPAGVVNVIAILRQLPTGASFRVVDYPGSGPPARLNANFLK